MRGRPGPGIPNSSCSHPVVTKDLAGVVSAAPSTPIEGQRRKAQTLKSWDPTTPVSLSPMEGGPGDPHVPRNPHRGSCHSRKNPPSLGSQRPISSPLSGQVRRHLQALSQGRRRSPLPGRRGRLPGGSRNRRPRECPRTAGLWQTIGP